MAKGVNKLSALSVNKASKAGLYGDGAGLWLQVSKTGSKSWLFRYMQHGKAHEMGLGAIHITFAECANQYIETHKAGWKNAKHLYQWEATLRIYAFPVIR